MYIGSWKIDDLVTFYANTHRVDTGDATDADSVPSYRVYEDETTTPIITGSMALIDSANTAGFYSEQITLSAANGFEKGKSYGIYISATVNGIIGTTHRYLQVEAEVDANTVSGTVATVTTLTNAPADSAGVGTLLSRMGTPSNLGSGATVAANLVDIENETDDIGAAGAGLTVLATQASVDDLPTNAELATSQAAADDATLAAIAALTIPTAAANAAAVLAAAVLNPIDANVQEVNDVTLQGDGSATPWGPV